MIGPSGAYLESLNEPVFVSGALRSNYEGPLYWVGDISTSWDIADNWASQSGGIGGVAVPKSVNAVIFDDQYITQDCICDVEIDIASIDVQSTYDGTLDFNTGSHAIGGDAIFASGGTVDCGDAVITISGDFDYENQTAWIDDVSTIILDGTSKTVTYKTGTSGHLYNLVIDGTITFAASDSTFYVKNLTVNSGKILTISSTRDYTLNNGILTNNGIIELNMPDYRNFDLLRSNVAVWGTITDSDGAQIRISHSGTKTFAGGVVTQGVLFESTVSTLTVQIIGNITFSGSVTFASNVEKTLIIDNETNSPDITFNGDVIWIADGITTWTKGSGNIITFSGTANQNIDFNDESVEDIVISNTAGLITFTGDITTDSFTQDAATDVAGAVTITVTPGDFVINGSDGNECTWDGPDLNIAGSAVAHWTTVTDSDATAGTQVDATDNCNDISGNNGWSFEVAGADRYWVGEENSNWNNTNNWAGTSGGDNGVGVPTINDDVYFDDESEEQECICDIAITCASINVQSTYIELLDFANSAYAHSIAGNAIFAGGGAVHCGDAVITCSGDFNNKDQTGWLKETSEIILDGTSKILITNNSNEFYDLTIDGTILLSSDTTDGCQVTYELTVNSSAVFTLDKILSMSQGLIINNGTITVNNPAKIYFNAIDPIGTINGATTEQSLFSWSNLLGNGTLDIPVKLFAVSGTQTITTTGPVIFAGDVEFETDSGHTLTFDNSGNYDLTFQKNIVQDHGGTFNWTKGDGNTITLSGTASQSINFNNESIEDIIIDKTAETVTLTGNMSPDTVLLTDGILDIDGNDITTIGAFTQAADTVVNDTTGGGLITVGGNFAINGSSSLECTWNGPDLSITGTAVAHYTNITNSDASIGGGTQVDATDNCNDIDGNTNWSFGEAYSALLMINGQIKQYLDESPNYPLCLETNGILQAYSDVDEKNPIILDNGNIRILGAGETLTH